MSVESGLIFQEWRRFSLFHFVVVAFMKSADFKSVVNDELIFFHADQILVVEYINGSASARRRERKF